MSVNRLVPTQPDLKVKMEPVEETPHIKQQHQQDSQDGQKQQEQQEEIPQPHLEQPQRRRPLKRGLKLSDSESSSAKRLAPGIPQSKRPCEKAPGDRGVVMRRVREGKNRQHPRILSANSQRVNSPNEPSISHRRPQLQPQIYAVSPIRGAARSVESVVECRLCHAKVPDKQCERLSHVNER